jgi:hypothetical protein
MSCQIQKTMTDVTLTRAVANIAWDFTRAHEVPVIAVNHATKNFRRTDDEGSMASGRSEIEADCEGRVWQLTECSSLL